MVLYVEHDEKRRCPTEVTENVQRSGSANLANGSVNTNRVHGVSEVSLAI